MIWAKEKTKWRFKQAEEKTAQTKIVCSSKLAMYKVLREVQTERGIYWSDRFTKARKNIEAKNRRDQYREPELEEFKKDKEIYNTARLVGKYRIEC